MKNAFYQFSKVLEQHLAVNQHLGIIVFSCVTLFFLLSGLISPFFHPHEAKNSGKMQKQDFDRSGEHQFSGQNILHPPQYLVNFWISLPYHHKFHTNQTLAHCHNKFANMASLFCHWV